MESKSQLRETVQHWYLPLIAGIIFILAGLYTFSRPLASYLALGFIFAISFIIAGAVEIYYAITNKSHRSSKGWAITVGILDMLMGIILFSHPGLTLTTLPLYVGLTVLFRACAIIALGNESGWLIFLGVLGVVFALLMIFNPAFGGMNIIVWTGLSLLSTGIFSVFHAFRLKKVNDRIHE